MSLEHDDVVPDMIFVVVGDQVISVIPQVTSHDPTDNDKWPESLNGEYPWEDPECARWAPDATKGVDRVFD